MPNTKGANPTPDDLEGDDAADGSITSGRRGIQSVGIGFRVLAALAAEAKPAALGAVARRAGLSPSQAHRYLASLTSEARLEQFKVERWMRRLAQDRDWALNGWVQTSPSTWHCYRHLLMETT